MIKAKSKTKTDINVDKVTLGYVRKQEIIKEISLNIKKGSISTIIGPNGSGKSTLLKGVMRFLKIQNGSIKVAGKISTDYKIKEFARKVAYVPQHIFFPDSTNVYDFISYGRNPYSKGIGLLTPEDKKAIEMALDICDIQHLKEKDVRSISGGQQQIVAIALSIAQEADIIILDEPNSYLDIEKVWDVMEIVKHVNSKHGTTVLMTLHDINLASRYSDDIIMFKEGKLFKHGTPAKVLTVPNIKKVYNVNTKLVDHHGKPFIIHFEGEKKEHKDEI